MKKRFNLSIFAIISVVLLLSLVVAETCSEDGSVRCYDRLNAQICADWNLDGKLEWGFCSLPTYGFQCVDKKAFLTIGVAVEEFQFSPLPPASTWGKSFACAYGKYYEVSCSGNNINVRQTDCARGCDGDVCKGLPSNECSSVGHVECYSSSQYRTCLEGSSGNNVWGSLMNCQSGESCIEGKGCEGNNNLMYFIIGIALVLIIYGGYKFIRK